MAKVSISSVIDAPAAEVWARIRDFNGMPNWHPRMVSSQIEGGLAADQVGCVRVLELITGARLREKLLALSDRDMSVTYAILETPQPISNHAAILRLFPVTDGNRCFAQWSASFDCAPDDAAKITAGMGENVFQGGFNALKAHFAAKS